MKAELRSPGGTLGTLSMISALLLLVLGVAGMVGMAADAAFWNSWSNSTSDNLIAGVFFALTAAGSYGFVLMDRAPWPGAALAVLGGVAFAMVLFWAVLPIVIGLGAATVAVMRARALSHPVTPAPHPPTTP